MDIQQLRYFKRVVDDGSLSKAAASFFMTPQAMRKQPGKRDRCRDPHPHPQGVFPSDAGRALYDYAQRLIALTDEAVSVCRQRAGAEKQRLHIGLYHNANLHLMPRLTARFTEERPDIELVITDFVTFEDFERALVEGKIDVVMTFGNSRRRKSCFCSTAIPWGSAFEWWRRITRPSPMFPSRLLPAWTTA